MVAGPGRHGPEMALGISSALWTLAVKLKRKLGNAKRFSAAASTEYHSVPALKRFGKNIYRKWGPVTV